MPLSKFIPNPLTVARGGTGVATLGDAGVLIGNGTGAVQVSGAGTSGQVFTSNGAGVDPTFQAAAGGGGLVFVAADTTERTTTSTTVVDVVTISSLSLAAGTRVRVVGKFRKTSGAIANARLGLKINSTAVFLAGTNNMVSIDNTNAAYDGSFWLEFEVGEANYAVGFQGQATFNQTAATTGRQVIELGTANMTNVIPAATVTDIIITGLVTDALVTLAINDVRVYSYANS